MRFLKITCVVLCLSLPMYKFGDWVYTTNPPSESGQLILNSLEDESKWEKNDGLLTLTHKESKLMITRSPARWAAVQTKDHVSLDKTLTCDDLVRINRRVTEILAHKAEERTKEGLQELRKKEEKK